MRRGWYWESRTWERPGCPVQRPSRLEGRGWAMDVDLGAVHTRESEMTAPELLMSESQERMMAFVSADKVEEVLGHRLQMGRSTLPLWARVTEGPTLTVRHDGEVVAQVPAASLADDAPMYNRRGGPSRLARGCVGQGHRDRGPRC